jgi:hypothetical protein
MYCDWIGRAGFKPAADAVWPVLLAQSTYSVAVVFLRAVAALTWTSSSAPWRSSSADAGMTITTRVVKTG